MKKKRFIVLVSFFVLVTMVQSSFVVAYPLNKSHNSEPNTITHNKVSLQEKFFSSESIISDSLHMDYSVLPLIKNRAEYDCSSSGVTMSECEALVNLYHSTNGSGWTIKSNWLVTSTEVKDWFGLTVTSGHVTQVNLANNNLVGTIPADIGNLSHLTDFDLVQNQLSGAIPASIGNMGNLVSLHLSYNQLSDPIPSTIGNLSNLVALSLHNNQLSGSIPTQIGNLSNLMSLSLHTNALTGPIPSQLGNLSSLKNLWLHNNQLDGAIPSELGQLSNLVNLYLYLNNLTGSIPPQLGNLGNLEIMYLSNNNLGGALPSEFGNLSKLNQLFVDQTNLSGPIPLTFTALSLNFFAFFDTSICEPTSQDFQDWKATVTNWYGTDVTCSAHSNFCYLPLITR